MRVDPEVCAEKFAAEVSLLRGQADMLRSLGAHLIRVDFPEIDVLITPTRKLNLGVPRHVKRRGNLIEVAKGPAQQYTVVGVPALNVTPMPFGVRFGLDDYDIRAPSVTFRHPTHWKLLQHDEIPAGVHTVSGVGMNVVLDVHPLSGRPFFCMAGVREYHEHPQHSGVDWLLFRQHVNVFATLMSIIRCCCTDVAPVIVVLPEALNGFVTVEWIR